jgi:flagellum-specific peptidoglycan hydrolase FlgJ
MGKRILILILIVSTAFCQTTPNRYKQYIYDNIEHAKRDFDEYGVPVSISFAQSFLESDGGNSIVGIENKNHFGVKTGSWKNGSNRGYRVYESVSESFRDHARILVRNCPEMLWCPADDWFECDCVYAGPDYWKHVERFYHFYNLQWTDDL